MQFDKKIMVVITLCLFLLLLFSLFVIFNFFAVKVANNYTVHNINTGLNYKTIQAAINANETLDGHTIFVEKGIYYEDIFVNKSLSLIGENKNGTIIDGNRTNIVIHATANNVTIEGFTVRNGTTGIYLDHSKNSLIMANNVSSNGDAILVRYSNNCTVHQNLVANNTNRGILITNSWNFTVNNNHVFKSGGYGINANSSTNGLIEQNNANENYYDGIGLLNSNNCTVTGNNVTGNTFFGILVDASSFYDLVYHNNIINNGIQASSHPSINRWDNGIEGNYWSDYTGADSDHDGIGNSPYDVAQGVQDNYPLVGMFYSFNASLENHVEIISNSTIMNFEYLQSNNTIKMYVFGEKGMGFCRMCIPTDLMSSPYRIIIDAGLTPVLDNRIVHENGTYKWVYFAYQHSTHEIVITPEVI
jgi:parallel beta-helix repeat protein